MGGAFVAVADGWAAVQWNPAGLWVGGRREAAITYGNVPLESGPWVDSLRAARGPSSGQSPAEAFVVLRSPDAGLAGERAFGVYVTGARWGAGFQQIDYSDNASRLADGVDVDADSLRAQEFVVSLAHPMAQGRFVIGGSFKLVRHSRDGQALIVALVAAGGCFGSMAEPLVSATRAQALEDSVYLLVPLNAVRHILNRNAVFALALLTDAEARRRKTEERAAQLAFEAVSQRLARLLLDTSDQHSGEPVFPLTQTEIANLIGSRRETVCSILNRFRRDNLVWIRRGRIRIRDRQSLSCIK